MLIDNPAPMIIKDLIKESKKLLKVKHRFIPNNFDKIDKIFFINQGLSNISKQILK